MKIRLVCLLLVTVLAVLAMSGCQTGGVGQKMESAGSAVEHGMETAGDTLQRWVETIPATGSGRFADPVLTLEEARDIALKHAGFTADQVTALHTKYEIEHGIPQYDVEFHHENREYDYEIHADSGEILSFSKEERPQ